MFKRQERKKNLDLLPHAIHTNRFTPVIPCNVRTKTIKLLEEGLGQEHLHDPAVNKHI